MKHLLFILFLKMPFILLGQDQNDILRIAQSQTVRIVSTSFNSEHKKYREFGKGIVLKGKYVATCFHLISPEDTSYKLFTVYLIYNEKYNEGNFTYDSILLKKDFKAKKGQYDFSKHIFRKEDRSTDFVVLKLSKKLAPIKYNYYTREPNFLDKTYSLGNVRQGNLINPAFQQGLFMFNYTSNLDSQAIFFACAVPFTNGFSGTPLYSSNGEVLGIVQYSIEYFRSDFMNYLITTGQITDHIYKTIETAFLQGYKLQFAIDFNFLKIKYLKGYL
jgi:hypothetical protein